MYHHLIYEMNNLYNDMKQIRKKDYCELQEIEAYYKDMEKVRSKLYDKRKKELTKEIEKKELKLIEELADFEKEGEVIGLMMYLGDPPELKEHRFTESRSKCLELKEIAEENSNAYYECAKVNAVIKGKKIVSVIEELEVLE
jgi:hypothetical protein